MNTFHMCLPIVLDGRSGSQKKKHGGLESGSKEAVNNRVKKLSTLHSTPVHANPLGGQKIQSAGKLSAAIQVSFLKETPILRYTIASIPLPGYLNKSIFAGEAWCFEFI
jgi:hypothetical protein